MFDLFCKLLDGFNLVMELFFGKFDVMYIFSIVVSKYDECEFDIVCNKVDKV